MVETWSEANDKGMQYLIGCAVNAVQFHHAISIANGAEIALAEIIDFVAAEVANDVFPSSAESNECDVLYTKLVKELRKYFEISRNNYAELALMLGIESFIDVIEEHVQLAMKNTELSLREAVDAIIAEVFEDLDDHPVSLSKILQNARESYEPPIENREQLIAQLVDQIMENIREHEQYVAQKTGTEPDPRKS